MRRSDFESMGDRQKLFEGQEASRRLLPGLPVLARLDGRAFHTFCRGLAKPYDERMSLAMIETTKYLVEKTNASVGYTQSDEISLAFPNLSASQTIFFEGKVQKICSVLASMAAAKFNQEVAFRIPDKARELPVFDARVWAVPSLEIAAEHFLWREADATRNSLTMAAHAHYSHKELHKAGYAQKHEMLHAKGVNWDQYPAFFKRGSYIRREVVMKELTSEELSRIPEKHRPSGPVARNVLQILDIPPLGKLLNAEGVLFRGELPEVAG